MRAWAARQSLTRGLKDSIRDQALVGMAFTAELQLLRSQTCGSGRAFSTPKGLSPLTGLTDALGTLIAVPLVTRPSSCNAATINSMSVPAGSVVSLSMLLATLCVLFR